MSHGEQCYSAYMQSRLVQEDIWKFRLAYITTEHLGFCSIALPGKLGAFLETVVLEHLNAFLWLISKKN